jgi:hypothetical protein
MKSCIETQYGVEVNAREPGSEVTALYLAAQANAVDVRTSCAFVNDIS